jgi:hypothetical protein
MMKNLLKALVAMCVMSMASGVNAGVIALFTNFSENDPAITSFNLETQQSSLFGSIPLSDGNYPTGLTLGLDGNVHTNIRGHLGLVSFDINGNYLGKFSPQLMTSPPWAMQRLRTMDNGDILVNAQDSLRAIVVDGNTGDVTQTVVPGGCGNNASAGIDVYGHIAFRVGAFTGSVDRIDLSGPTPTCAPFINSAVTNSEHYVSLATVVTPDETLVVLPTLGMAKEYDLFTGAFIRDVINFDVGVGDAIWDDATGRYYVTGGNQFRVFDRDWSLLNSFDGVGGYSVAILPDSASVPEPTTTALLALGLFGVGAVARRRSN